MSRVKPPRSRRRCVTVNVAAAMIALLLGSFAVTPAWAADHRDGPRVTNNSLNTGALDLNDLYLFVSPVNRNNTVMVLTTGGAGVGILSPPFFFPGGIYEFRISNDGNPVTDELVLQLVFSAPNARGQQSYHFFKIDGRTERRVLLARGVTGRNVIFRGNGLVRAGLFDDPFFFDALAFSKFRAAVIAGAPLADRVAPFVPPSIPNNFFGNFNTLAIVVEIPRVLIQSRPNNPNISMWIRTLTPDGTQFDRTARPGINTVVGFEQPLFGIPNVQDTFNSLTPADDAGLRTTAADRINHAFGLPLDKATGLVGILLPDVMTFKTTDRSGFFSIVGGQPKLNGRRLTDDVIDDALGLLTDGALKSDRVINDSVFQKRFPYLGAPLPRSATLEAMRVLSTGNLPASPEE